MIAAINFIQGENHMANGEQVSRLIRNTEQVIVSVASIIVGGAGLWIAQANWENTLTIKDMAADIKVAVTNINNLQFQIENNNKRIETIQSQIMAIETRP